MNVWIFVWLMLFLKIPIAALFLIVRWAVKQTPETEPGQDGGIGPRLNPLHPHPHHPRRPRPPRPRRGPHGRPSPGAPARVRRPRTRLVTARARLAQR